MEYLLEVISHNVDSVTGHNTFSVYVVELDESGTVIGEGPAKPLGIGGEAMDKGFGGHGETEFVRFVLSLKQMLVDTYVRTKECGEHGPKLVGRRL